MSVPFPLASPPTHYRTASWPSARRCGVFYVGEEITFTLNASGGPNQYQVFDFDGTLVSSGGISGTTVTPNVPTGGWRCGWYRVRLLGSASDSLYGQSHGATMFTVIRDDARFKPFPAAATPWEFVGGEQSIPEVKGILFSQPSRMVIHNAANPNSGSNGIPDALLGVARTKAHWSAPGDPYADPVRERRPWVAFDNTAADLLTLTGTGGTWWMGIYPATPEVNGATTYVSVGAGTASGTKLTIYSPNSSAIVETFDNLPDNPAVAASTINAASAYVKAFSRATTTPSALAVTAIGSAKRDGVIAVVSALYPDVECYEGPGNEPVMGTETVHCMRLFQGAVHAGHASAKALGPCGVTFETSRAFFELGGGAYCDEISSHGYNTMTFGDINLGRHNLTKYVDALAASGQAGKKLWETEANNVPMVQYGNFAPRRARASILYALLLEQFGIPKERSPCWYDLSHNFWSYSSFWMNGDRTVMPVAGLYRTLAEETFGKAHDQAVDFGEIGNRIFLGSAYTGSGSTTVAIIATSYLPGATVTLAIGGAQGSLTVVDAWGNESTVPIVSGRAVIPVREIPTYVRLPVGATSAVYRCNDWPPRTAAGWQSAAVWAARSPSKVIVDGKFRTIYDAQNHEVYLNLSQSPPDSTVALEYDPAVRLDRVIVFAGTVWQQESTLVDFDVQTSNDGVAWTTRATVTRPTPASVLHGAEASQGGSSFETFWDEQWIFDVPFLGGAVTCKAVRLYVRATSVGGHPDLQSAAAEYQTQHQNVCIQEVMLLCDDNTRAHYVVAAP